MMEYNRQNRIYDPEEQTLEVTIIGAGSTGSFVALNLAKMGVNKIKVIDFDKIEEHNVPNQFYRLKDVGKSKVKALQEIIKDFTGTEIEIEDLKVTKKYDFDINLNSLIILCVDTIEGRKLILDKLKGFQVKIIDTRFGGEGYSLHTLSAEDEEEVELLKDSLDKPIKETGCGQKAIIYTILSIASEVCNIVKKMEKSEPYPRLLRRELKTYKFICGK